MSGARLAERLLALARDEQDARLGRALVQRGLLSPARLDALMAARQEAGASLRDLLAAGEVPADELRAVDEALASEDWTRPPTAGAPLPPEIAPLDRPERQVDEFILVERLGRGGTGEVWKAWDRLLSRFVALKLSPAALASPEARARFEREAMAVARLDHPGIVPIHRFGAAPDGRPFLVMRHIAGRTLQGLTPPLPQALAVVRDAALALAHAHERGVIHRDVKPANVMLDDAGAVWVLDFGLVHLRDAEGSLTRPHQVLGTAAYMAPEQASTTPSADAPAADVYGLGATLYHLLTGADPFDGDSFEAIVAQVIHGRPVPPRARRPDLPRAVEIVVMKAMEKEPSRRYASAAALADDLGRLIAGEPIAARPPGAAARLWRSLGAQARAVVVAAAALGVAVAFGGWWHVRGARQQAATMAAMRNLVATNLETALRLRRAGDLAGMKQVLPPIERAYAGAAGLPPRERARLEYLMGRLCRALMQDDRALAHQERALAHDPDLAPALYERAVHLSRAYGRQLARAHSVGRAPDLERHDEVLRALHVRARADLERLARAGAGGDPIAAPTPVMARAARGILAFHLGRGDEARAALEEVVRQRPDLEEAWETLAAASARDHDAKAAERVLTRALERDAGYVPFWVARCRARLKQSRLDAAIEDATRAVTLDREVAEAWLCRGTARIYAAHERAQRDRLGGDELRLAEDDLRQALAREPTYEAQWALGMAARLRGAVALRAGDDPRPALAVAQQHFARSIALDARSAIGWRGRGWAHLLHARHLARIGAAPRATLDAAIADLTRALALEPTLAAWELRGEALTERAADTAARGGDPDPDLAAAAADLAHAFTRGPGRDFALVRRASLHLVRGRADAARGRDPVAAWAQAEQDLEQAARQMPGVVEVDEKLAALRAERAQYLRGR